MKKRNRVLEILACTALVAVVFLQMDEEKEIYSGKPCRAFGSNKVRY